MHFFTNLQILHSFLKMISSSRTRAPLFRYSTEEFAARARLTNILNNIQPSPPTPRTSILRALIREKLPRIRMEHELQELADQFESYEGPSDWSSLESPPPPSPSSDPILLEGNQQMYFGTEEPTEEMDPNAATTKELEQLCEDCPWLDDEFVEKEEEDEGPNEYDMIEDHQDIRAQSIQFLLNRYPLHQHPEYDE